MSCGSIPECLPRQVPQCSYGQEHMKLVKPFTPRYFVFRQKMFLISRYAERKSRKWDYRV